MVFQFFVFAMPTLADFFATVPGDPVHPRVTVRDKGLPVRTFVDVTSVIDDLCAASNHAVEAARRNYGVVGNFVSKRMRTHGVSPWDRLGALEKAARLLLRS